MSAEDGMRRSSTTSTVTSQPSSVGSTPVTASGAVPSISATCCCPARAACAAVISGAGSVLASRLSRSAMSVSPLRGIDPHAKAGHGVVLGPGQLVVGDLPGGVPLFGLLELAPDPGGVMQLPVGLVRDDLQHSEG